MDRQNSKITALYSRLSKDDFLTGESQSIANQKMLLEQFAEQNGFANPRHFSDDGHTGVDFDRPSWQEMMAGVEAGSVGVIIVKTLDRMGRNYLQTGLYRERFRKKGVRLISMQEGHDSDNGDDDLLPIRELMSEWYARDTSRKVKTVLHAKGRSGKHMTNSAVYGYKKSPDDKNLWLVDDEAAHIVRRIFEMTVDGKGPYQIARTFTDEKLLRPSAHIALRDGHEIAGPDDQFTWTGMTIKSILDRREYMGDTVNFRSRKESFKSKKHLANPESEWQVFENTQEPVVSREMWETAQKCRVVKRRPNSTGEPNPLTGLVYCGDCGSRMYNHRGKLADRHPSQDSYACVQYSQYPPKCTCHYISTKNLREVTLTAIRTVSSFVKDNEAEFVRLVREESESRTADGAKENKRKLARDKKRAGELDKLIKGLYEDKVGGSLSAKRFEILSREYETEQENLETEIASIETSLAAFAGDTGKAKRFIGIVRRYTDFSELTASMLNEYVERILVFEAEKINRRRKQRVEVHLNFIGQFNVPLDDEPAEEEPYDPIARRREIGRNYYYRNRDEILAKKSVEREQAKAEKLTEQPAKSPEELAAGEAARREHRREYQRNYLARRYVQETFVSAGMCADICIHDPGREQPNPHAHILLTMRPIDGRGEWAAKSRKEYILDGRGEKTVLPGGGHKTRKINAVDWNDRTKAEEWRKAWAAYANGALRMAGVLTEDNALDHRSYERQGVDKIPTVHMGVAATQMERKGIRTERGDLNREIEISNKKLLQLRARINKLNGWLDNAEADTTPALADVLSEMLSGGRGSSRWQQIRDLQMAAKTLMFIQENNLTTIEGLRGKVGGYHDERQAMGDKLKPFERRIKTLDLHLAHSENFAKHRKVAMKRDALFAEARKLDTQSLIFKGKAKEARKKAEDYGWQHLNALNDYNEAEKYLRGVLQKRFGPDNVPVEKWRQERETLAREKGGLNTEYAVLKDRIAEVERIRKYAEEVQRAIREPRRNPKPQGHVL